MSNDACRSAVGISSGSKVEEGKRWAGWTGGSSFFRQLYITMAVAILTLAIVASVTMSWQADRQGSANLIEQGIQAANNLASRSQLALIYHEPSNASDAINIALAGADVMAVEIRQEHGELLFYKPKTRAGTVPPPPQSEPPPERLTDLREGFLDGETADAWVFVAPVLVGATADAQELMEVTTPKVLGYVRIVKSKATMARMRSEIYAVNFAVSILVAGVLLVIVRILSQQLIRPLTRLSKVMTAAEGGRTDVRAEPTGPKDIRDMAKIFNQMMDVLETREKELRAARDEAVQAAQERVALAQAEQERLEAMVAERTKSLNDLLETRGQIVSNASHELRTPVNALRLLVDATHLGGTERRASVQKIDAIVEHMSRLVENLLLLNAGPERSVQRGVLQAFDLGAEIRATGNMLESIQQASAVKFELDVTACDGLWVQGDLTSYRQILINVLTNAFKFTEQGRVGLKAMVSTDPARQMVHCTVTIADTGHGLPAEQHDRIFEPFVTTRSHSGHTGTGLGLPISRQLAREMGGDLRLVRSIVNVGSEFACDVWFDAVTLNEAQQGPSSNTESDQYAQRLRVLLAEDDPITADAMAIIIGHLNHDLVRVATVADLETALASDTPYDVALIDNRLPGGRGLDVIRKVRTTGTTPRTKLVLLSAETGSIAVAAREVCDAMLTKPTGANTIQQLLGTAAPRDEVVAARILDPAPLVMLQSCGATEGQLREMWDTFVVTVAKEIGTIQELQPFAGHVATEERLWEILHPLGSACSTIGAVALGKAFKALRQCRTKSDAEEQLKRIQAILEATQVEFEEQLFAAGEKQ